MTDGGKIRRVQVPWLRDDRKGQGQWGENVGMRPARQMAGRVGIPIQFYRGATRSSPGA